MSKLCIWCLAEKEPDQFYVNQHSNDGKQSFCIECKTAYDAFIKQCVNVSVRAGRKTSKETKQLLDKKHTLEQQLAEVNEKLKVRPSDLH